MAALDPLLGSAHLDDNPLIVQVKRQPTRLTLRRTLWLGFSLGLLSLIISTAAVLTTRAAEFGFFADVLFITGWLITALTPFLTAVTAAALTRRSLRPERFDLIRLTPVDNKTLIHGLVFTAFYRMRLVYVVLVAYMPVLVVEVFFGVVTLDVSVNYVTSAPNYWRVVTPTLSALADLLLLWMLNLLGAVVGVRLGLLRMMMIAVLPLASLFYGCAISILLLFLYDQVFLWLLVNYNWAARVFTLALMLFLIGIPYALARLMLDWTMSDWQY